MVVTTGVGGGVTDGVTGGVNDRPSVGGMMGWIDGAINRSTKGAADTETNRVAS